MACASLPKRLGEKSSAALRVDWPGDPTQHYQLLLDMKRSLKQRVRNTEKPEPFIEAFSANVSKIPASAYTDSICSSSSQLALKEIQPVSTAATPTQLRIMEVGWK